MGYITKDCYDADECRIYFKGWTHFNNPEIKDFTDVIMELKSSGKDYLADRLTKFMRAAEFTLKIRLQENKIKFSGDYHQNGDYGTPVFEVKGMGNYEVEDGETLNGVYKWTCSFRYWGGIMEECGYGKTYMDWAWGNPVDGKPTYPDKVIGEQCIKCLPFEITGTGVAADAYDPEFDKPLGD